MLSVDDMTASLWVQITPDPDSDEAELNRLSYGLRRELLALDVDGVERATDGHKPVGAKSSGATLADVLVVSISNSTVLVAIIQLLRRWIRRGNGRKVKINIGKDHIEIDAASPEEQARLIESWLEWHEKH
jgi:hypothetical protein